MNRSLEIKILGYTKSGGYAGDDLVVRYKKEDINVSVRFNHDVIGFDNGVLEFQCKEGIDYSDGAYDCGVVCGNILRDEKLDKKLKDIINKMFEEQKEKWRYPCC